MTERVRFRRMLGSKVLKAFLDLGSNVAKPPDDVETIGQETQLVAARNVDARALGIEHREAAEAAGRGRAVNPFFVADFAGLFDLKNCGCGPRFAEA